ncbi:MAG: hypothetical protein JWR75_2055 [Devosia sp.]|nr:hypothetical protein [Devosia sp.]
MMTELVWPELWFIRHGQTDWNAEGRYQGSRDIPLNDVGRAQADLNGALLRRLIERSGRKPGDFNWYVSPLGRTRETMERVRNSFTDPLPEVAIEPRLVEISFGKYEGLLHTELATGLMPIAGERDAAFWMFRPDEGESYEDLATRIISFAGDLKGPSVIVSHGGVLRVFRRLIEDFAPERAVNWFPPQDSVVHFADGKATVYPAGESWDD